jgi:hypothetical protein
MEIGLARLWIDGPHQGIVHLWEVIWSHGVVRNSQRLLDPV